MNSFEQLSARLSSTSWNASNNGYSPSVLEIDGIVRWLGAVAQLAQQGDEKEVPHVLSSPARMLGHRPADDVVKAIDRHAASIADAYARVLVKNAMEWADMVTQGQLPPGLAPDLFEPILALLERGCQVRLSKGFLEVGDRAIPIHRWPALSIA